MCTSGIARNPVSLRRCQNSELNTITDSADDAMAISSIAHAWSTRVVLVYLSSTSMGMSTSGTPLLPLSLQLSSRTVWRWST